MEADDDAVRKEEERLISQQWSLYETVIQFVLIPLAVAAIGAVLNPIADWIWHHR